MRASVVLMATALFAAAGCSEPDFYWYRAGGTFEEIHADYCACREKAQQAAAEVVADDYFDHLRSPLWTGGSTDGPGRGETSPMDAMDARTGWGEIYEQNAFMGCMRSRGYLQLKAHRTPAHLRKKNLPMGAIAGQ